jgi:serine/threonine protein kinase
MTVTVEKLTKLLIESDVSKPDQLRETITRLRPVQGPAVAERVIAELLEARSITALQGELLLAGRSLLMGHYVLCEKIGEGGMGTVYAARHRHMGRMVALKVIRPDRFPAAGAVERFQREIQVSARLRHTNIVVAYDAGEAQGSMYLVMELIEGCDLARRVRRHGVLGLPAALDVVRQTALGLAYLHSQKVVHRDIKPSNLLLDRQGVVKILDLGLSRMVEWSEAVQTGVYCDVTASGELLGSVDFMSPEQFVNARSVDARADLYSLGCTLYGLVSGKPPFTGASVGERIVAHREQAIPSLREVAGDAPPRLDRLFRQLLAKDPSQRPNDANTVIAEIDALGILDSSTIKTAAAKHSVDLPETEVMPRGGLSTSRRTWTGKKIIGSACAAAAIAGTLIVATHWPGRDDYGPSSSLRPLHTPATSDKIRQPSVLPAESRATPAAVPTVTLNDDAKQQAILSSPKPASAPRVNTSDKDRTTALWAIKLGGEVQVQSADGFRSVQSQADLPRDSFRVQRLNLAGLSLADVDFTPLAGLTELVMVDLGRSNANDLALRVLGQTPSLTHLSLMGTQIDDSGLALLNDLAALKTLDLRGTGVTDEGLVQFASRHSLEEMRLGEGQILHDSGAESLAVMQSLKSLGLRHTNITDKAVRALAALERLEWLDLGGCAGLSDAGIAVLSQYKSLRQVLLDGVTVSPAQIAELEAKQVRVDR